MTTTQNILDVLLAVLLVGWIAAQLYVFIRTMSQYRPAAVVKLSRDQPHLVRRAVGLIVFPIANILVIVIISGLIGSAQGPGYNLVFTLAVILMGLAALRLTWLLYQPVFTRPAKSEE